jgi:hypothetical protein
METPPTSCPDSVVFLFGISSVKFNSVPSGSTTISFLTSVTVSCLTSNVSGFVSTNSSLSIIIFFYSASSNSSINETSARCFILSVLSSGTTTGD